MWTRARLRLTPGLRATPNLIDACVEDDILDVRDVLARVQGSINTFEDGPPKVVGARGNRA